MRVAPNQAAVMPPPAIQPSVVTPPQAIGQVMRVEVLAQLDLLRYKLRTPAGERIAESRTRLTVGDTLKLHIVGGDGKRLIVDTRPSPAQQVTAQLKSFLPKQLDASRLLALLPVIAQHSEAPQALRRLLAHLPTPAQLTDAQGLQLAMKNSGVFYEHSLAQGQLPPPDDLKRQLLALRTELKQRLADTATTALSNGGSPHAAGKVEAIARAALPSALQDLLMQSLPPTLLQALSQELDGVLARLVSHQLLIAADEHKPLQQWLLELPVRDRDGIDVLQIHLSKDRREPSQQTPGHALWTISLSIALPAYGAVVAKLSQQDECVHVHFHAEHAAAHAWLSHHCPMLRQRLQDCGVRVGHVQAQRGMPHDDTLPVGAHGLLQERA